MDEGKKKTKIQHGKDMGFLVNFFIAISYLRNKVSLKI